jgi:glyoxylase-like metal-dependent hydrolase (beta-lactamase superfamily II)
MTAFGELSAIRDSTVPPHAQADPTREVGRGERVLPGLWRLRLPLPWPGVPHCNAWAIASGSGIVLVDTGTYEPGSLGHLERALDQVRLKLEDIQLVVITHAHADHCGQAHPIADHAGCEVWAHPTTSTSPPTPDDPEAAHLRRVEIARQSGVPKDPPHRGRSLAAGPLHPDRDLLPGLDVESDLGTWSVHETPGHAPSHVVLFQRERRLLISGDHLLGRVSLYFDYGYTPDPVGEFLGRWTRSRGSARASRCPATAARSPM